MDAKNVTIEFCFIIRISYELQCTVIIEHVRTFNQKCVPAKFQKYLKHISWVIRGTSSSKLSCNPRHPPGTSVAFIVTISCNHRYGEYFLHRITRKLGSTAASTDYTCISGAENEALRALSGLTKLTEILKCTALTIGGHEDDGCSCNHRAVSPSAYHVFLDCVHVVHTYTV